jgi:lipoyl(octanoyl) transferase
VEVFEKLQLWIDPVERAGPEAMAVDEWLLETARMPVLRVYRWSGAWASLGYFGKIEAAQTAFPGVGLVRRWTGGGMVDHRADWTYTVVAPQGEPLAGWRGAESYRHLHTALAAVLVAEGIAARMSGGGEETGRGLCFENPVTHDLLGADGRKLAGAGQRRSLRGLLHQGSVAGRVGRTVFEGRARALARLLAREWEEDIPQPETADLESRVIYRYRSAEWTGRR